MGDQNKGWGGFWKNHEKYKCPPPPIYSEPESKPSVLTKPKTVQPGRLVVYVHSPFVWLASGQLELQNYAQNNVDIQWPHINYAIKFVRVSTEFKA